MARQIFQELSPQNPVYLMSIGFRQSGPAAIAQLAELSTLLFQASNAAAADNGRKYSVKVDQMFQEIFQVVEAFASIRCGTFHSPNKICLRPMLSVMPLHARIYHT